LGRRPLGAILHSSNEPGELSQWLCHDDSTINIVVLIIIIIIIIGSQSRFLPTPPAFDARVRAVPVGILPCRFVWKN